MRCDHDECYSTTDRHNALRCSATLFIQAVKLQTILHLNKCTLKYNDMEMDFKY